MERAIAVSCNAYFAQLGVHDVGSKALAEMAERLGLSTGDPAALRQALPFAAYGQGPVLVTPFKMARVAATIAAGGQMPQGRWIAGDGNAREDRSARSAAGGAGCVSGGRHAASGHRGHGASRDGGLRGRNRRQDRNRATRPRSAARLVHGFAPFDGTPQRRLAFAVIVENGGYGGRIAAPVAREVMEAAKGLGLL